MKCGDLVKRKNKEAHRYDDSYDMIAIVLEVKKLNNKYVDNAGSDLPESRLVKVIFPKTSAIHVFPENYLELISEV